MEKQGKQRSNNIFKFLPKAAAAAVTFQNPPFSPGRDKRFSGRFGSTSKNESFEESEPTSPKISCMGQIKHKKNVSVSSPKEVKKRNSASAVRKMFTGSKPARKSEDFGEIKDYSDSVAEKTPSLGQMKKFASGRDLVLSDFDWEVQIVPGEEDEQEEEVISAAVVSGGGGGDGVQLQPRKEINLWKRRTMNPPKHLQIDFHG